MTHDQLLSVNAKLSVGNPYTVLRKYFPWFHGVTDNRRLSDGYFYIYLPPIFMCLLSHVLMYLSKKRLAILLYMLLFSLTKNT